MPGTVLRILATGDLAATVVPARTGYGRGGTCAGIAGILEHERRRQPAVWLDTGDLAMGPAASLPGVRPWEVVAGLPVSAAAAGNHEFDDGVSVLRERARRLPFPLLCANADAGLPGCAVVDTGAGPIGVIGLTHPHSHRLSRAPRPRDDWQHAVPRLAHRLRQQGARWTVALLHDGAAWWPRPGGGDGSVLGTRPDRLADLSRPWAESVDLVLGGHTLGPWSGRLHGTPAGHSHPFAASVLVVDVPAPPATPVVRGNRLVPPLRAHPTAPTARAGEDAAARVVGHSPHTWLTRSGSAHYLPRLMARLLRRTTGAEAAFVPAGQHWTQAPLDGAVAALCAGEVSWFDVLRLFPEPDDHPVVAGLCAGEFRKLRLRHDSVTDPRSREGDWAWWNWCRMPCGWDATTRDPRYVAVMPSALPLLGELLGREPAAEPTSVGARAALVSSLG
ncbi:metallophosphoesterase [Streptomyces xinghaiensis]|uniref:metallophosphoesterase n=1 Tax=Streptomyces xinghaiensis TaxID=1038928 RepID=UPI0002D2CEB5|nr:metallophosphoesterase [Streptomyces xinghaiensis]MZE75659.1 hypothetical protein [Streptomyces sp. SID5475]